MLAVLFRHRLFGCNRVKGEVWVCEQRGVEKPEGLREVVSRIQEGDVRVGEMLSKVIYENQI